MKNQLGCYYKKEHILLSIVLAIGFVVISKTSKAQFLIGFEAGITENILVTNLSNRPALSYHARPGVIVAIPIKYHLNNWLSIKTSLTCIRKNVQLRNDSLRELYQNSRNTYVQMPFSSVFSIAYKQTKISVELGVYEGYWLLSRVRGETFNFLNTTNYKFSEKYQFNSRRDQRWETGWLIGSEVQFPLYKKYPVSIHYCFYQSLTDQQKKYMINQVPRYNRTHTVTFGYPISFHTKKKVYEKV